jgi:hypothetical protein
MFRNTIFVKILLFAPPSPNQLTEIPNVMYDEFVYCRRRLSCTEHETCKQSTVTNIWIITYCEAGYEVIKNMTWKD